MANLVSKNGYFQSAFRMFTTMPVCEAGVSNEGASSSTIIRSSNGCKRVVVNEASLTPWCHAAVHFEVKNEPFFTQVPENHKDPAQS